MIINLIKNDKPIIEYDSGFFFGKGLFETILILKEPVFLDEHLERLNKGLKKLEINNEVNSKMVYDNICGVTNCALKIMVSEKNIILSARELKYTEDYYDRGFKIKLSSIKKNPESPIVSLKSFNYLENIIEKEKWQKQGFDEAVFLNINDYITEGTMSNIFIILDDFILTPSVECGLLNGVVRNFIINKLGSKFNIIEGKIPLSVIKQCKGMFITNSLLGVMWVRQFENLYFPKHKIYEEIRNYYNEYIKNNKAKKGVKS
ncbi:4-amino-4-deoxychorismate lyase [Clostridium sp. USBA 49]|jgi:4-amino-4-deoxychorismate lyase|uniref:aminotransferase class IV n=1 Tax=Clostridium TaxID=1485 RepID=UPI00099A80DE|nr:MULTISPECIES: aminotransferase class IV [Clostridium]SKA87601.1 4-amino-4-deoxychorismate lyase [Clostridium sp. USBA 49]